MTTLSIILPNVIVFAPIVLGALSCVVSFKCFVISFYPIVAC